MGRKVIFTEEQLKHIAEACGGDGEEILEATACGAGNGVNVDIQGNHEEPIVKGGGFDTKKDEEFWEPSLNHQAGFKHVGDKK